MFKYNPNYLLLFITPYINWLCSLILSLAPTILTVPNSHCLSFITPMGQGLFLLMTFAYNDTPDSTSIISLFPWIISSHFSGLNLNALFLKRLSLPFTLFFSHCKFFFSFRILTSVWIMFSFIYYLDLYIFPGILQCPFHFAFYLAHYCYVSCQLVYWMNI